MTISIGTSAAPSAWDTHAAWLRQREDCGHLVTGTVSRAAAAELSADEIAALAQDVIARMTPAGMAGVLSTAEVL